jgi:hypothetical protein
MRSFTAQSGQSIFDLASIAYGDCTAILQLKSENPSINISDNNFAGKTINYTPPANTNFSKTQLSGNVVATAWQDNFANTDYLLQEDGFDFDLESGTGKIELEN